jgi:hypothetical protein
MEVDLHPEGPATGQLDHYFPWFYSIAEQMLQLVPKFHFTLSSPNSNIKISLQCSLSNVNIEINSEHTQ